MSQNCENRHYVITIENKIINTINSDLPLDPDKHLGIVDENNDFYHIKQKTSEIILERSGYINKNNQVVCIDNHQHKEREIGPLVNHSTLKSFSYFAKHYLDLKDRVESLIEKPTTRIISLDLLILQIGALNYYKGLGDYQYLYESLDKKFKDMTQLQSK